MQNYIGYGFDTNDIPAEDWVNIFKKYDTDMYQNLLDDCKEDDIDLKTLPQEEREDIILDFINEAIDSTAEYLRDIINKHEAAAAGTDYIVEAYDNFLVFESIRFIDDESARAKYIRSENDFIAMIDRYIPLKHREINFGNIWDGIDWVDPCFFMD